VLIIKKLRFVNQCEKVLTYFRRSCYYAYLKKETNELGNTLEYGLIHWICGPCRCGIHKCNTAAERAGATPVWFQPVRQRRYLQTRQQLFLHLYLCRAVCWKSLCRYVR